MGNDENERGAIEKIAGTFEVTLTGETIVLPVKPILPMREFRKCLGRMVAIVQSELGDDLKPLISQALEKDKAGNVKGEVDEIVMLNLLTASVPLMLGDGLDLMVEALWLYAPELEEKHKATADESEIVNAALEVLKIAFPLILGLASRGIGLAGSISQPKTSA